MTSPQNHNLAWHLLNSVSDDRGTCLIQPDGREITYAALAAKASRYANVLTELGCKVGDRVAVQTPKTVEALALYLGTLMAGLIYLPLNNAYKPTEINYFLGDAEPRVFVCTPKDNADLQDICISAGVIHLETLGTDDHGSMMAKAAAASDQFETLHRDQDDLAAILYTSGTTGRSKGVMLSHNNLLSNTRALIDYWKISSNDVLLHALPVFHTHGLFVGLGTTFLAGASAIYLPRFDVDELVRHLPKATTMMGVPTFYSRLLSHPEFNRELVAHMRLFVSGSAPLSAETHKKFHHHTGHHILERYGMTETNMNTSNPYEGERIPGTVGFPLPGVELRIANADNGDILAQGETGVIEVKGDNVFKGYWRNEGKTREEFRQDGFFITGDMGRIDKNGYVSIVGRCKDLIITGGFNVYPAEVEAVLDAIDEVIESAVIGIAHPDFGEAVVAIIATTDTSGAFADNVIARCNQLLAGFKSPKKVIVVDALPRNTMGKIQKNQLRETHYNLYS